MFDDEVIEQQVEETPVEQEVQQEEVVDKVETTEKRKIDPAESFKIVRERAQKAERERDEIARRLQELEAKLNSTPEEDLEIRLGDDDLAEGKHLSKVDKKIKKMQQELQQYKAIAEQNSIEVQLKRKHADFDEVVSEANIEALREQEPDLFDTITASNDLYKKGLTAYKMIKQLGIGERNEYKADREIAEKNLGKPRPLVSGASQRGNTPLSQANAFANGLTKELQEQLWKEMQETRRRS